MIRWSDVPSTLASLTFAEALKWFSLRAQIFFDEEYAPFVGAASMAASPQVLGLWLAATHVCRPSYVYETGTGASTILFQNWVEVTHRPVEHLHAEDNRQWLKELRSVANRHYDLPSVVPYDQFWAQIHPTANKVFLMDGFRNDRVHHAEHLVPYQENMFAIFDDANRCDTQTKINGLFNSKLGRMIEPIGCDPHGRYAALWVGRLFPIDPSALDFLYSIQ